MSEKLRAVFLPVLLLAVALALGVALLNGLVLETGWLPLDEDVAAIWLPLLLAIAAVAHWVEPRIRVLALNEKRNINALYVIVALAVIAGPAILVQKYVQAEFGTLVPLRDVLQIAAHPQDRYFAIPNLCLKTDSAVQHTRVSTSGDHDEDLDITVYAVVPACAATAGTAPAWLGTVFRTTIDNRLPDARKDAAYRAFLAASQRTLDTADPRAWRYLERVGVNSDRRGFLKALTDNRIARADPVFLMPHAEAFAHHGETFLGAAALAFAAGAALWALMIVLAPLKPLAGRELEKPGVLSALLLPTRAAFGLPLLLDLNLLVYLAMVLSGLGVFDFELDDLIAWGASSGTLDHGLGVVRLFTATFVHAGLFHLLGNMYGLLFAGMFLTPVARNLRLLASYAVCGLGGSLLSVAVHPDIVVVGASGAIFGLFGVLLTLIALRDAKLVKLTRPVLISVGIFIAINVVYGATTPSVDNFAHIGGFLAGIPCGLALYILDRREKGYGLPPAI